MDTLLFHFYSPTIDTTLGAITGALSKIFEKIPNPFAEEVVTKTVEEPLSDWIDNILGNEEPKCHK
ncbi:hypothetical protein ABE096_23120 [Robertmurraya massiliosenegalensis]|uniref:hypothetical protein n=1 Tax=Robertmurraya massiliosenegalensis TaxID=1287657 RepID=UPI003D277F4F